MEIIRAVGFDPHRLLLEADLESLRPDQVFDAFAVPELLVRWWPQTVEIDLTVGGKYHLAWPKMEWSLRGSYWEIEKPPRPEHSASGVIAMAAYRASDAAAASGGGGLSLSWSWDHEPEAPTRDVALRIDPFGPGTRIFLEHDTHGESDAEQEVRKSHEEGWRHFLPRLAELEF